MGYSPAQFARIFKKISGMTFGDYLNKVKVCKAVVMLKNRFEKYSCTRIADECGFGSVRNFNRVFLKYTGFAPKKLPENFTLGNDMFVPSDDNFIPTASFSQSSFQQ